MSRVRVKVWGDLACFTRPDLKAERQSYPVMTPSAARGILDAICWRPSMFWAVRSIAVLRPIRFIGFRRNEVTVKAGVRMIPIVADDVRAQRFTLALRDVAYLIEADARLTPKATPGETPQKFAAMFERRVAKGQCFTQPSLGLRECAAFFAPDDGEAPIEVDQDLGTMLHDLCYGDTTEARFFAARLERGVLRVPDPVWMNTAS